MQRGHAEALAPLVRQLMQESKTEFRELTRISVTTGPGTFTGIRIALSFARGLGVGLNIPVIGFSTLEAMALRVASNNKKNMPIWVAIDARREEVYAQAFTSNAVPITQPNIVKVKDIEASLKPDAVNWIGSGSVLLAREQDLITTPSYPDVAIMAAKTMEREYLGYPPHPLYLRTSDAKPKLMNKDGLRLEPISTIHSTLLAAMHKEIFTPSWSENFFHDLLSNPTTKGRIAVDANSNPCAFMLVTHILDQAEIISIGVLPKSQKQGIGKMLLARFSEELGSLGVSSIYLDVAESNQAALSLYKSFGFEQSTIRQSYYSNGDNAISMVRQC